MEEVQKPRKFTITEIKEVLIPKAERGEYGEESKLISTSLWFFLQAVSDKGHGDVEFICGAAGEKDSMGLYEYYFICPTYGLDGSAVYKKHKDYDAPGW